MASSMDLRGYLDSFIEHDGSVNISELTERVNAVIRRSPRLTTITSRPLDRDLSTVTDEDIKKRLGYIIRIEQNWRDEFHEFTMQPEEVQAEPLNNCQIALLLIRPTESLERTAFWGNHGAFSDFCGIPPFLKLLCVYFVP